MQCAPLAAERPKRCLVDAMGFAILVEDILGQQRVQFRLVNRRNHLRGLEQLLEVDGGKVRNTNRFAEAGVEQLLHVPPRLGEVPVLGMGEAVFFSEVGRVGAVWRERDGPVHEIQVDVVELEIGEGPAERGFHPVVLGGPHFGGYEE